MLSALSIVGVVTLYTTYACLLFPPLTTSLRRKYLRLDPLSLQTYRQHSHAIALGFLLTIPYIFFAFSDMTSKLSFGAFCWKYLRAFGYVCLPVLTQMIRPLGASPLDIHDILTLIFILVPIGVDVQYESIHLLYKHVFETPYICFPVNTIHTTAASLVIIIFGILRPIPDTGLTSDFRRPRPADFLLLVGSLVLLLPVPFIAAATDTFTFTLLHPDALSVLASVPLLLLLRALPLELIFRGVFLNLLCARAEVIVHASAFLHSEQYRSPRGPSVPMRTLSSDAGARPRSRSPSLLPDVYLRLADDGRAKDQYNSFDSRADPPSQENQQGNQQEGLRSPLLAAPTSSPSGAGPAFDFRDPPYAPPRPDAHEAHEAVEAEAEADPGEAFHEARLMPLMSPGQPSEEKVAGAPVAEDDEETKSQSSLSLHAKALPEEAALRPLTDATWRLGPGFVPEAALTLHGRAPAHAGLLEAGAVAEDGPEDSRLEQSASASTLGFPSRAGLPSRSHASSLRLLPLSPDEEEHFQQRQDERVRELDSPRWGPQRPELPEPFDVLGTGGRFSRLASRCCMPLHKLLPCRAPAWMRPLLLTPWDWLAMLAAAALYAGSVAVEVLAHYEDTYGEAASAEEWLGVALCVILAGLAAGYTWRVSQQLWVSTIITWVVLMLVEYAIDFE